MTTLELLQKARSAISPLYQLTEGQVTELLYAMADRLIANTDAILKANEVDVNASRDKLTAVMIDRLTLTADRIIGMAKGMKEVADLPTPLVTEKAFDRPNGLHIEKVRVPFGVVGMIYESRPNVTADGVALCLKSRNVPVMRCGKEAHGTSVAIMNCFRDVLSEKGYPVETVNLIEDTSRASASEMMTAVGLVDLLIPRGGKGLIASCVENAKVPCIQTGTGICHIFVDESANQEQAIQIIRNAKTSRPSVCNAMEVLLVHKKIADTFLPKLYREIPQVEITETEFDTEFLDYKMAVKTVENVSEAIDHIALHSTHHSDGILTENEENAQLFTALVDSAVVYVNASTRFTDGGEFGLGCEIGISTQKLHARGPMGLEALTTYKYIVKGKGQIR